MAVHPNLNGNNGRPLFKENVLLKQVMNYQFGSPSKGSLFDQSLHNISVKNHKQMESHMNHSIKLHSIDKVMTDTLDKFNPINVAYSNYNQSSPRA